MRRLQSESTRAATPLFWRLSGPREDFRGERKLRAQGEGLNRLEFAVLAAVIPAVVVVAVLDALWRLGGPWVAWGGVLPVSGLALHAVAVLPGGARPAGGFWKVAILLGLWSIWILSLPDGGWVRGVALATVIFLSLQVGVGLVGGVWSRLMRVQGWVGVVARLLAGVLVHLPALAYGWKTGGGVVEVLLFLGTGLLWVWGTFLPGSQLFGPTARMVEGEGVLVTVDDGPDPVDTPALLDRLDQHGVKAVFFVIGEKVRQHPELAREIVARGHELGNHTMTHPQATMWCAGPWRTRREIVDCQRAIEEVTGQRPRWYRAPVGHRNYFTHPFASELGLEVVAWSRRGFDTVERDVRKIVSAITREVGDGDVLLLHEATPVAVEVMEGVLERVAPRA
ncbi:peptidoglycan/xylan/chitin deacetylase (PgdA/CDA1 family)/Flp pilus assembly pilin Flp [Haloferula luteola]|uniref:Peptidoglycan/xylan/chitin deacetylase (PgdA/CDA1 family)/Flp pilus assembly pilin Flp n=1 Tax=Haloferula luteola TaxID=595692 RepID=A0A840V1G9_9BACT|nr:peptidoglycan/xylan/chitin deacetylase (PgdA/CDA1 family)/Flp pilus assembly pilin Flp [Haloferula luteola]